MLVHFQLVNENNEIQFIQCLSSCADGAGGSGLAQLVTGSSTGNGPLIIQPLSTTIKHELGICEDVESHLLSSQHHQNNNETVECMVSKSAVEDEKNLRRSLLAIIYHLPTSYHCIS